jgi:hypothetical protein
MHVSKGIDGKYDVITTFDVVHDAVNPAGLLRAVRDALKDDGIYSASTSMLSIASRITKDSWRHFSMGASISYCMTSSLAHGGAGLGTLGFNEKTVREAAKGAGFSAVRRVPLESPFNILYEIRR